MKKLMLLSAVAVTATVAAPVTFAQSSVTLWGRLNTSVESVKYGNNGRIVQVNNNGSRLGLRGVEDLGGGLKAGFNIEHGFNSDNGAQTASDAFWNRQSNVYVSGEFGTVKLGLWYPESYYAIVDPVSMHNHDNGLSSDKLLADTYYSYRSNKLGYVSPNMGGLTLSGSVRAGEGTGPRAFDSALRYKTGNLNLAAAYSQNDRFGATPQRRLYQLEADYGFDAFTFAGYMMRESVDGYRSRDSARVAMRYTLGPSEFHVNVGGTMSGGDSPIFQSSGAKQWTLGYNYNLSKRTKVYGYYTVFDANRVGGVGSGRNAKFYDVNSLAAGIRHNF